MTLRLGTGPEATPWYEIGWAHDLSAPEEPDETVGYTDWLRAQTGCVMMDKASAASGASSGPAKSKISKHLHSGNNNNGHSGEMSKRGARM